jgi:hypothetical protein
LAFAATAQRFGKDREPSDTHAINEDATVSPCAFSSHCFFIALRITIGNLVPLGKDRRKTPRLRQASSSAQPL